LGKTEQGRSGSKRRFSKREETPYITTESQRIKTNVAAQKRKPATKVEENANQTEVRKGSNPFEGTKRALTSQSTAHRRDVSVRVEECCWPLSQGGSLQSYEKREGGGGRQRRTAGSMAMPTDVLGYMHGRGAPLRVTGAGRRTKKKRMHCNGSWGRGGLVARQTNQNVALAKG